MAYDPYRGGWQTPSWWKPSPAEWTPWDVRPAQANAARFLNMLIPMMRTQEDMLSLARAVNVLGGGYWPEYGKATDTGGRPFGKRPGRQWQKALGGFWQGGEDANRALKQWLQGIWSTGQQYQKMPTAPGTGSPATRQQEMGFGRELRQALESGPAGSELYAPWLQRLFVPTMQRPMPGQWGWNPEQNRYALQKQPRFY